MPTVPFKMQSRADLMQRETAAALARAGCVEVWMGVESGSQKILDAMQKGMRVEQVAQARENLRKNGIRACFFLQFGYPGETWFDIEKTIQMVRQTRPDDLGISVSYPLPGTKFYERVREQLGEKTNWVDSEDLSMMFKGAYTSEFYRALHDALHAEVESWSAPGGVEICPPRCFSRRAWRGPTGNCGALVAGRTTRTNVPKLGRHAPSCPGLLIGGVRLTSKAHGAGLSI